MNHKKLVSLMLASAMTAGALTGCGSSANSSETAAAKATTTAGATTAGTTAGTTTAGTTASDDVVEITYWYSWTGDIQKNNVEQTELFNKTVGAEQGIHVTAEYQGSYAELHQKLQAAYVAGETPEVCVMEIASIANFATNGIIEPLDSYTEASGVNMDDFYEGLMENAYVDGTCYGLPYLRSTPILYVNNTLLKEAGYDYTDLKTWEDWEEIMRAVHAATGKYGYSEYSYDWAMEAFMQDHGTTMLNEEQTATNINSEEGKAIVNYFKSLIDEGVIHACTSAEGSDKVNADVQSGNTALWVSSTANLTSYLSMAKEAGFELQTCFIPKEVQYGVPTGGCCMVMTSDSTDEEKQAAWTFLNWMTDTKQGIDNSINTGYIPTRYSIGESEEMQAHFAACPQAKVALDQLEYGTGRPSNVNYSEASTALHDALDAIWVNGADVDSTLADLETKVNAILNQ